jgi:hypothetical protein
MNDQLNALNERRSALAEKQERDSALLVFHQKVYALLQSSDRAQAIREQARAKIALWNDQKLCHSDYINAWSSMIYNLNEFKLKALDDPSDNGVALRQNTPFSFLMKELMEIR